MRLERIEVQGLRTFRELEVFDLSGKPGLIHLDGANGEGKSSLWAAVCYCLYGKDYKGHKGPELSSWNAGRGIYTLCRVNGSTVVRTWGVNTLTIDKEDATQSDVDKLVGLTYEQYLASRHIAQDADSFLDVGAQVKTDLLASILNLDYWLDRSEGVALEAKHQAGKVRSGETELATLDSRIEELKRTNYESLEKNWARDHEGKGAELQVFLDTSTPKCNALEKAVDQATAAFNRAQTHEGTCRADYEALKARYEHATHATEGKWCKACGQRIGTPDRDAGPKVILAHLEVDVENARHTYESAVERLRSAQGKLRTHERDLHDAEVMVKRALDRLAQHKLEVNPYTELARTQDERIGALEDQVREISFALDLERRELECLEYWVKAFKDVRLFLVAEALSQLEVETNSALVQLGLPGWSIRFAPDSETKAGAIKRGLSVTIESPDNPRPVPWTVWSGGEAQRLRNATTMGLGNLIEAYTGCPAFVEVWDEPTNGMNKEGIDNLLEALKSRAVTQGKQIWVIDHRSLASGTFMDTITAVKVDGATHLERN